MLNTGFGSTDEEARRNKELAKAALDALVAGLEAEGFETTPVDTSFAFEGRTLTLDYDGDTPCPECGVDRSRYTVRGEPGVAGDFCPHCWQLDVLRGGRSAGRASRGVEKQARDLPPGFSFTLEVAPEVTIRNPADTGDPDHPFDLAAFEAMAAPACETGRQAFLAQIYNDGVLGDPDPAAAYRWWGRAAESGHAVSLHALAVYHLRGLAVAADDARAVELLRESARRGCAGAMFDLGCLYADGRELPQDDVAAAGWWRMAAHRGDADAQRSLGLCLLEGKGVPADRDEALQRLRKAAEAGDAIASRALARLGHDGIQQIPRAVTGAVVDR